MRKIITAGIDDFALSKRATTLDSRRRRPRYVMPTRRRPAFREKDYEQRWCGSTI